MKRILSPHKNSARQSGFTLPELMIAIAVGAILVTLAVPSIRSLLLRNELAAQVNALVSDLNMARGEAAKRWLNIVVCPSNAAGTGCGTLSDWRRGWFLFADADDNNTLSAGDTVLRRQPSLPANYTVTATRQSVIFQPNGSAGGTNLTITFNESSGLTTQKQVVVSSTGRIRMEG